MQVHQSLCLSDNYLVLIRDPVTGATAAIDAPEERAVRDALAETGWRLTHILVTHRHHDHIAGVPALKAALGVRVVAPAKAARDIPDADDLVGEGDAVAVGSLKAMVFDTPGHCSDHIAYHFADARTLIAGDTLFAMGCGRVLEGGYEAMWGSLSRLAALPEDTIVYCGHEYTVANAAFAVHAEPSNAAIVQRQKEVIALRAQGKATLPTTIALEKATNPFVRAGSLARFTELREAKNRF